MARYRMDDGTIVDTANASQSWDEATSHDANNHISIAAGSQWNHEALHRSRKGRYYIERWSQWQGSTPSAEWISNRAAAAWLTLMNGHRADTSQYEIPADLQSAVDEVTE